MPQDQPKKWQKERKKKKSSLAKLEVTDIRGASLLFYQFYFSGNLREKGSERTLRSSKPHFFGGQTTQ